VVGSRPAARRNDLFGHVVGRRDGFLLSRKAHAEVVDHYCRALGGECPRHPAADSASTAGYGGNFTVELAHRYASIPLLDFIRASILRVPEKLNPLIAQIFVFGTVPPAAW